MNEESKIGMYDGISLLRLSNSKKDAEYEAAAKDSGFTPKWRSNPELLPREPPSSARMKCVPAVESTGSLLLACDGSLTTDPESVRMMAVEPVSEDTNA